jgi:hypothetical protein
LPHFLTPQKGLGEDLGKIWGRFQNYCFYSLGKSNFLNKKYLWYLDFIEETKL